jgi:hypothetical protein
MMRLRRRGRPVAASRRQKQQYRSWRGLALIWRGKRKAVFRRPGREPGWRSWKMPPKTWRQRFCAIPLRQWRRRGMRRVRRPSLICRSWYRPTRIPRHPLPRTRSCRRMTRCKRPPREPGPALRPPPDLRLCCRLRHRLRSLRTSRKMHAQARHRRQKRLDQVPPVRLPQVPERRSPEQQLPARCRTLPNLCQPYLHRLRRTRVKPSRALRLPGPTPRRRTRRPRLPRGRPWCRRRSSQSLRRLGKPKRPPCRSRRRPRPPHRLSPRKAWPRCQPPSRRTWRRRPHRLGRACARLHAAQRH